jgi:alpha-tubulin suppressor-like RCC1 family protein
MALEWGDTEFLTVKDAISVDHAGIAITAVIKDDYTVIAWGINVRGATWPEAERIAREGAEGLREWLMAFTDFTITPDEG